MQILALDENVEAFVVHMTFFSLNSMPIYPAREAQIALLVAKEVKIPTKYSDFSDVFLEKKALILPKDTNLNQYAIELQKDQPCQRLYLAFKVTCWSSYPLCQEAKRQLLPMRELSGSQ